MAVDEAILEQVESGQSLPTLRLYAWDPPCLSLGYAQPAADLNFSSISDLGWDWVRRPTGGRAILHTDEITYSVIGRSVDPRLSGSVLQCYQRLASALLRVLFLLDIPAEMKETLENGPKKANPVCFEVPSNYEITAAGKKLLGSAQARRRTGVLQHGSLPLTGDLTRITRCLAFPDEIQRQVAAQRLLERAATVEQIVGSSVPWDHAADAFIDGFSQTLNLQLIPQGLTIEEEDLAEIFLQEKYSNDNWNKRL